jgi:phosphoglycolate phosphatase
LTLEECIRQLTEARGFRGDVAGIASVYRDLHVSTAAPGATLFPRAEAFLAVARASGCSLALVSQKSRRGLAQLLSQFSIERFFELVLGADDVSVRKPDPALFTRDIRSRFPDVDVQRVLVVGDTPTDLQFARNIGACSCWAEYGYGDVEQCLALMPTYRISAIADLSRVCGFEGV